jgi:uncharacterized protein YqjF (DUF2071 family)
MQHALLTAFWSDLVLLSFEAPEPLLRALVPPRVELDRWQGRTHVSLVALRMRDLRVGGWRVPGLAGHAQLNFRTYIRYRGEPGVWFVRELVPSRLIAMLARLRYGEPCGTIALDAQVAVRDAAVHAVYRVGPAALGWHLSVTGSQALRQPSPLSPERYFTERGLACRARRGGRLAAFHVAHPTWAVRAVSALDYDMNFEALYGAAWRFLNDQTPVSAIFAAGSEVAVSAPVLER